MIDKGVNCERPPLSGRRLSGDRSWILWRVRAHLPTDFGLLGNLAISAISFARHLCRIPNVDAWQRTSS